MSLESNDEPFLREEINRLEKYYIELYDSTNPNKGYNITIGGLGHEGNKGAVISPQCREACIKSNIGRKQSEEQILRRYLSDPRHKKIDCFSRATFDNLVREGKLPRGQKVTGFKELFWIEKDFDDFIKSRKNDNKKNN